MELTKKDIHETNNEAREKYSHFSFASFLSKKVHFLQMNMGVVLIDPF